MEEIREAWTIMFLLATSVDIQVGIPFRGHDPHVTVMSVVATLLVLAPSRFDVELEYLNRCCARYVPYHNILSPAPS